MIHSTGSMRREDHFRWKALHKVAWKDHMRTRIHNNHLGYHLYNSLFKKAVWWKRLWKLNIMPEIKVFIWHLCRKALPTKDRLSLRGVNVKGGCYFCDHNEETLCHLFFCCLTQWMLFFKLTLLVFYLLLMKGLGWKIFVTGQGISLLIKCKSYWWFGIRYGALGMQFDRGRKCPHQLMLAEMCYRWLIPIVRNQFLMCWCSLWWETTFTRFRHQQIAIRLLWMPPFQLSTMSQVLGLLFEILQVLLWQSELMVVPILIELSHWQQEKDWFLPGIQVFIM